MSIPSAHLSSWELAHLLAEPRRREVFDCVRRSAEPLTRDEVARLTGINRRLATFHLDRLCEANVLLTHYARPPDRKGGPGAGRPAKRYRAADVAIDLSLPPRQYEFATRLLVQAITAAPHDAVASSLRTARVEGKRIGELRRPAGRRSRKKNIAEVVPALTALGYEPDDTNPPTVRLRNCPFRSAADIATELVCGMNCELVGGLLEGLELDPSLAQLRPAPPDCCVTVTLPS